MKIVSGLLLLLVFFSSFCKTVSAQEDQAEKLQILKYEASYLGDFVRNNSGGLKKGSAYLGMANFHITFDTKAAGLWNNGEFFINAVNTHGGRPSNDFTGDYQGITNIEAGNLTYLQELWFQQTIGDFSLTAGLQDLCSEFAVSEYGGLFLNGSFGVHSTIANNIPAPIFPLTSLGFNVSWNISDAVTAKMAAFDGLPDDFEANPYNLSWNLGRHDGILTVSEFDFNAGLSDGLTGTYKLGTYYHNHLTRKSEAGESYYANDYGIYMVTDQMLLDRNGRKLAFFTQAALSPSRDNENNYYLGAGINYSGLFESRQDDILGLAVAHAGFFNSSLRNETAIELSYRSQLNENIFIQPDIQYIINPAGTGERLNNTLAAIVRLGIGF